MNINVNLNSSVDFEAETRQLLADAVARLGEITVELTALNETLGHYFQRLMPPQGSIDEPPVERTQAFDPDATMRVRRP